jgi:predicted amidohydrolase
MLGRTTLSRTITSRFLLISLALAVCCMGGTDAGVPLTVATVQFRSSFDIKQNEDRIAAHLKRLAAQGVKVAAFPECALTGYDTRSTFSPSATEIENAERELAQVCRSAKISAVIGSAYRVNGHLYDTALVIDSQGQVVERYGKIYLAGEQWATPGNHIAYFDLEGVPSSVIICHDERYPELVRLPAIQGARVIYYISSESAITEEHKLAPYRAQVMARAVENGVFIVQANAPANPDLSGSHGQSRIVAPDGNVLGESSFFHEDILVKTLSVKKGNLQRPLDGPLSSWWKQGIDWMMRNRHRQLD